MRGISRAVALLLVCHPVLLMAQNPAGQLPTSDQNSILNLYDTFGYQKRGTILDWGFSALVRYNGKTSLVWFIPPSKSWTAALVSGE